MTVTAWYAPAAKRMVKMITESLGARDLYELESYQLR
jgi:hypothetical protein